VIEAPQRPLLGSDQLGAVLRVARGVAEHLSKQWGSGWLSGPKFGLSPPAAGAAPRNVPRRAP
jgi:hypothetical protein